MPISVEVVIGLIMGILLPISKYRYSDKHKTDFSLPCGIFKKRSLKWQGFCTFATVALTSSMAIAQTEDTAKPVYLAKPKHYNHLKSKKTAHKIGPHSSNTAKVTIEPALADPHLAPPDNSAARFDKTLRLRGWNFPFPSYGDTLTQDYGGWRSTLAKYGIGLNTLVTQLGALNTLNTPSTNSKGAQIFWGQKASTEVNAAPYLVYDLSQWGVSDGQLQLSGAFQASTWQPFGVSTVAVNRAAIYQTFFDRKLEVVAGYTGTTAAFVGSTIGGNIASPFGPSSSIPVEVGLSTGPAITPSLVLKYNMTDNLYNQFAVARSAAPLSNPFYYDHIFNPGGFRFTEPFARELFIDEIGYKNASAPNAPFTWFRAGAIYNASQYENYATTPAANFGNYWASNKSTTSAAYLLADRQLLQVAASSQFTAYRGLYAGVSAEYTPPETSVYSQYYEARLYAIGFFDTRPYDQMSIVYAHNVVSKYVADFTNLYSATTGTYARNATNQITTSYTARLTPGLYLTAGVSYVDHPAVTYQKNTGSALNFLWSVFAAF